MKADTATAPLDLAGATHREDPREARRRHFAAGLRWAHRLPLERKRDDKKKAYELMISNIKAGLLSGQGKR